MKETGSARLNAEIAQRYGNPEVFRLRVRDRLGHVGASMRSVALRSGLCYTHVLKVMNGKVTPRLETMLLLDEAVEQLEADARDDV